MQMRNIKIFTAALLGMLFFSLGCGKAVSKMTLDEGKDWFFVNKTELFELKDLLLEHPLIERVYPSNPREYVENYAMFDSEDRVVFDYLEERCRMLDIQLMKNWRSLKNTESVAITFLIDCHGISVSGCSISVKYVTSKKILISLKKRGDIIKKLGVADWYVIYSES